MKYGKEYARKVFELIPEAEFVAVRGNGDAMWLAHRPCKEIIRNGWWTQGRRGELGKVECADWRDSLIARGDVDSRNKQTCIDCVNCKLAIPADKEYECELVGMLWGDYDCCNNFELKAVKS